MKNLAVIFTVCLLLGVSAPIYAQVLNPANGHYYELIENSETWYDARDAAAGMSYNGMQGHLATITSSDENDFVHTEWPGIGLDPAVWIGGTDEASEDDWQWVTGETWAYTYWGSGEPNNSDNEDCLEYGGNEEWNDASCDNGNWYLVEFESTSVPTMNEWGMVIFMALAGLGAVYYLRKHRKV